MRAARPLMVLALAACSSTGAIDDSAADAGGVLSEGGTSPTPESTGLPCDVATVLADRCTSCHGATPSQGAPTALVTRADLAAPSKQQPGLTMAQASILRMKAATAPMPPPPAPRATNAEIAALQKWVAAGSPEGSCGAPDAGSGSGDAAPTPTVCTSGTKWTQGDKGSSSMHPGWACVSCHHVGGKASGKSFDIAGTVYPSAHEPDDCNGAPNVTVVITDANGKETSLAVNGAGNFYHSDLFGLAKIATPYSARVEAGGKVRAMVAKQTDGDCNGCHTEQGANGAPGRIMAP